MRIGILGAGPAGLYLAQRLRRLDPTLEVVVVEQNPADATYGFGVVFSDTALAHLTRADPSTFDALSADMESWRDLTIARGDERVRIDGNGYSAISRLRLLQGLQELCAAAGVQMVFDTRVDTPALSSFADCDLLVGADGVRSVVREAFAERFRPRVELLTNRFAWFGTTLPFPTLTLTFRTAEEGAFVAHHYRYAPAMSTFLVECDAATFERAALGERSPEDTKELCRRVFAADLGGHPLVDNRSIWRAFPLLRCGRWHDRGGDGPGPAVVLIGDALHTVHFSIGSGTRLAMEDALALAQAFEAEDGRLPACLERFEGQRRPVADQLVAAADNSSRWYETFAGRMHLDAWELAYDYMTRSGRVDDERLTGLAPRFMAGLADHRAGRSSGTPASGGASSAGRAAPGAPQAGAR